MNGKTFVSDQVDVKDFIRKAVEDSIKDLLPEIIEEIHKDDIYNSSECAEILKVSTTTLANWRKEGKIKYFQRGSTVRYTREHIRSFIKENEIRST